MERRIKIFDTTLRDGEQSPGCSMTVEEKIAMAYQLEKLGVDIIEAGFAAASPGDFEAIKKIAEQIKRPVIASLARVWNKKTGFKDILEAQAALAPAARKRIHLFLSTSDIHLKTILKISQEEAFAMAIKSIREAKKYTNDIQFSAQDATRTNLDFLCQIIEAAIRVGATTINIPDTVGYVQTLEYYEMIKYLMNNVPNIDKAVVSVHCHNDLGLATANSLITVPLGIGQIECTVNGIGERAGNASLEEVVMALKTRKDYYQAFTGVNTKEIFKTSRLLTKITGVKVQPNKAIVGENAFAHEAGIHQDGQLKDKKNYEIMSPDDIGVPKSKLVLGKHSGRRAFFARVKELGYELSNEQLEKAFLLFKALADKKKEAFDEDIEAIIDNDILGIPEIISLVDLYLQGSMHKSNSNAVTVRLKLGSETRDFLGKGDGPVDAAFSAIAILTGTRSNLKKFKVENITPGKDSQGEVKVVIEEGGVEIRGRGSDTSIVVAAAKAYVNALNRLEMRKRNGG
jgi:2-isopropylmalate synthase